MKPLRIYLDTSVISGCLDAEFADDSQRIMDAARAGKLRALVSNVVITEIARASESVRSVLRQLEKDRLRYCP